MSSGYSLDNLDLMPCQLPPLSPQGGSAGLPALPELDSVWEVPSTSGPLVTQDQVRQQCVEVEHRVMDRVMAQVRQLQEEMRALRTQCTYQENALQELRNKVWFAEPTWRTAATAATTATTSGAMSVVADMKSPGDTPTTYAAFASTRPKSSLDELDDSPCSTLSGSVVASSLPRSPLVDFACQVSKEQMMTVYLHLGMDTARVGGMCPLLDFFVLPDQPVNRETLMVALSRPLQSVVHWLDRVFLKKVNTSQTIRWKMLSGYWFTYETNYSVDQQRILSSRSPTEPFSHTAQGILVLRASDFIEGLKQCYQNHQKGVGCLSVNLFSPDQPHYQPFKLDSELDLHGDMRIHDTMNNKTHIQHALKRSRKFVAPTKVAIEKANVKLMGSKVNHGAVLPMRHFWNKPDCTEFLSDAAFQLGVTWVNEAVFGRVVTLDPSRPVHVGHNWELLPHIPVETRAEQLKQWWGEVPDYLLPSAARPSVSTPSGEAVLSVDTSSLSAPSSSAAPSTWSNVPVSESHAVGAGVGFVPPYPGVPVPPRTPDRSLVSTPVYPNRLPGPQEPATASDMEMDWDFSLLPTAEDWESLQAPSAVGASDGRSTVQELGVSSSAVYSGASPTMKRPRTDSSVSWLKAEEKTGYPVEKKLCRISEPVG